MTPFVGGARPVPGPHPGLVAFVNGLVTFMVPPDNSSTSVGPVYRHPSPPTVPSASDFRDVLLGGMVSGTAYFGSPVLCHVGLDPPQSSHRLPLAGCQLLVTGPLKSGSPQMLIASFECSGPLMTSRDVK